MKLGMYSMTPDPISVAYFINPSHQSVWLHVYAIVRQLVLPRTFCMYKSFPIHPPVHLQVMACNYSDHIKRKKGSVCVCVCVFVCLCLCMHVSLKC
jgi:hypothetical protein